MTGPDASLATTARAGPAFDRRVDPALLARASTGDVAAFDTILRTRLPRLYRMAVTITRSEADARDAVQDASIHAWRELRRLRSGDRFDAWLDQILVNACRSILRRTQRVQLREIDMDAGSTDDPGPMGTARSVTDPDATEVDAIRRAFERLDPSSRVLLALHYVEERPLAEIATATGSPVGTVKWRLSRARHRLERALEAERR